MTAFDNGDITIGESARIQAEGLSPLLVAAANRGDAMARGPQSQHAPMGWGYCLSCRLYNYADTLDHLGRCGNCAYDARIGRSTSSLGGDWFNERG